nr:protein FAR1-related sequence 5 [Tanacetum cinerariifolium]
MTKIPLISDALKEVAHDVLPVDAPPSFNKLNFKLKRDSDGTVHAKNIDDVSCAAEKRSVNVVEVPAHKFVNAAKDKTVQVTKRKMHEEVNMDKYELFLATSKFESRDELLKSVREFYYAYGYGISISNSRLDKFVILKCDREGPYRGTQSKNSQQKRSTSSRGVNCPFRITGKKGKDGLWEFRPKNLTHNHDPSSDTNTFVELLNELYLKYQEWPLHKKETATAMISKLINQTDTLFEPAIQRPKRTPKNKKGTTSTARDPSRFEYVESSQTHNPSSSSNVVQRSNEVVGEVSYIHHEKNMIDLNVCPNFPGESTFLELKI